MKITFEDNHLCSALYGERESHLRLLEKLLSIQIVAKGNELEVTGTGSEIAERLLKQLYKTLDKGFSLLPSDVRQAAKTLLKHRGVDVSSYLTDTILVTHRNRHITPRNYHQKRYIDAIRNHDLIFGIGPAGTGKTYLAMAMAVSALLSKQVEKIILVRPAVEAGERLGFLPGSLQDKINPYLRPLYDALYDMVHREKGETFLERGIVEVAPLAFMRGRTLSSAFVILDEAQNTSSEQMKMFLTRLGFNSKAVVTGDITQIDLPSGVYSGLVQTQHILKDVKGISFNHFDESDVVRHPLVQRIVSAYGRFDVAKKAQTFQQRRSRKEQVVKPVDFASEREEDAIDS